MRGVNKKGPPVRFNAQGKIFTIEFEVLMNQPDSYLAWLAQSHLTQLERGIPIDIDKRPEAVRRMLESYLVDTSGSSSGGHHTESSFLSEEVGKLRSSDSSGGKTRTIQAPVPPPPGPPEHDAVIKDAVRDVLHVLKECRKWGQLHDKAIFVLRWGRSSNCDRVLRPYTVKMYESLTGKLYDVRSSADFGSTRTLNPSSSGFSSIISAQTATFISPAVQELIVERIRAAGFSCSFVDIGVNGDGVLLWKNKGPADPSNNAFDGTVRCLVVNTR